MIQVEVLKNELELFLELKKKCESVFSAKEVDTYGFKIQLNASVQNTELMIFGLTHGNEVIGLQIINKMIQELLNRPDQYKINFLFQLNNIGAYLENKRFIDFDLNRSFLKFSAENREFKRADELEKIILDNKPKLILDLHQTVEATNSLFAIIPEHPNLVGIAKTIASKVPVVTFPVNGFSNLGKTLTEFAISHEIPALVYELGQKGFIDSIAEEFKHIILGTQLNLLLEHNNPQTLKYWHIETLIPNQNNFRLVPDLKSFMPVQAGQILATNALGETYNSPFEGMIIFPRYQNIQKHEEELAYIAIEKSLAQI